MKKIHLYISMAVGVFVLIGGFFTFDSTYTRARDHRQLKQSYERNVVEQEARYLRQRMWDLERNYGTDEAKRLREYQELEEERKKLLRKLK